ncbi:hypothetical protein Q762_14910 [Flavobacterium cauense R2A-7]|nr:hypothetical protein Q762_14910 [Flavobacterium cauense R2A-7]
MSCNQDSQKEFNQSEIDKIALELKKRDIDEINKSKRLNKIDSLSEYQFSNMKKFIDSIKVNDSVTYFALRKALEKDTSNYYDDFGLLFFNVEQLKSDKQYQEQAKEKLMRK